MKKYFGVDGMNTLELVLTHQSYRLTFAEDSEFMGMAKELYGQSKADGREDQYHLALQHAVMNHAMHEWCALMQNKGECSFQILENDQAYQDKRAQAIEEYERGLEARVEEELLIIDALPVVE